MGYGTEDVDEKRTVVNPVYRQKNQKIKKENEKLQRLKARLMNEVEKSISIGLDEMASILKKHSSLAEQIQQKQHLIDTLKEERKTHPSKIQLSEMPDDKRYNKLKTENRLFIHIIKMICYRAESAMANQIAQYFTRSDDEKRMLIKQIIQTKANICPDYNNKTLTVTLHSLSTPRYNEIVSNLTTLINQTEPPSREQI